MKAPFLLLVSTSLLPLAIPAESTAQRIPLPDRSPLDAIREDRPDRSLPRFSRPGSSREKSDTPRGRGGASNRSRHEHGRSRSPVDLARPSRGQREKDTRAERRDIRPASPPPPIPGTGEAREDITRKMEELRNRFERSRTAPSPPVASESPRVRNQVRPAEVPNRHRPQEPSARTRQVLDGRPEPDRSSLARKAATIRTPDDASRLVNSVLGADAVAPRASSSPRIRRLSTEVTGRSSRERSATVNSFVDQLLGHSGRSGPTPAQNSATSRGRHDHGVSAREHNHSPRLHRGNRRVVCYSSRSEIPPILLASHRLDRVEVRPYSDSGYIDPAPTGAGSPPSSYRGESAHTVAYQVDPGSALTRDDILFRQGSTAFADAYSHDIVADLAEALRDPRLAGGEFVIEGHASAEGAYGYNLDLSQRRAERIARDLVGYGVDPSRLVPVGYGESEARYPAGARESLRSLDRRVVVFRLE